jgi:hypothetical protein
MDWDKMSNIYKGHSIDASYQVSVHSVRFASHAIESFFFWTRLKKAVFVHNKLYMSSRFMELTQLQMK